MLVRFPRNDEVVFSAASPGTSVASGLQRLERLEPDHRELQREIADTAMRLGHSRAAAVNPGMAMRNCEQSLSMCLRFLVSREY